MPVHFDVAKAFLFQYLDEVLEVAERFGAPPARKHFFAVDFPVDMAATLQMLASAFEHFGMASVDDEDFECRGCRRLRIDQLDRFAELLQSAKMLTLSGAAECHVAQHRRRQQKPPIDAPRELQQCIGALEHIDTGG